MIEAASSVSTDQSYREFLTFIHNVVSTYFKWTPHAKAHSNTEGAAKFALTVLLSLGMFTAAQAQEIFKLTSPLITNGGVLPDSLKCERDGGKGLSPPVALSAVPEGTDSLALIMYHYPKGTVQGVDPPSQYWLLWNIPVATHNLPAGNPDSVGNEGSDKDGTRTGYTPPCSPRPWWSFFSSKPQHEYFIEAFALSALLAELPGHDDQKVDWATMTKAMQNKILASSKISFWN